MKSLNDDVDTMRATGYNGGMDLSLHDIEYLANVANAVKSDNPPQLTTICPECDEAPDYDDDAHITLNTLIPGYWKNRDDWGYPDPYGMTEDDRPFVLIGCQGYHLLERFSTPR